ncbi:class I SAM-dependent methyltransferase [Mucilaginibacter terrae]|uniref:Class I SAM-dependent methyltransferase n=1 Tax=Mucilaginibacter terrae TaxID=1955052 RepID=A0ABU3GZ81_9SPHI|nr:class I SAM-dependent methyltransferase [Mucilaginibacter terrae]MDT3404287.1 hypothetical protein [Mucilaginibacter terrae]
MSLLDDLYSASTDPASLDAFIDFNYQELYDYFTWRTDEELSGHIVPIKNYITRKRNVLLKLPTSANNLSFLALLLEVSERLSLEGAFSYLFNFLHINQYEVGARIKASHRFLLDTDTAETYGSRFEEIYNSLESAINSELDNADKVLTTIVNYYVKAIADFGKNYIQLAQSINKKISIKIREDETSFLNRPLIWDMLQTELTDFEAAEIHIRQLLDDFLQRGTELTERIDGYLIEEDTSYTRELESVNSTFSQIRGISVQHYADVPREVFDSLHRGVQIITNESQLYVYMYSYGQMHYRKLYDSFRNLYKETFAFNLNIIDWGCGQGMATMVLLEYLAEKEINLKNAKVLLIEPSAVALRRASLHVKKFQSSLNISTINKNLDELTTKDFKDLSTTRHLHLFSNILDIDFFSLNRLVVLIKSRFKGSNHFVIVSPYVNDTKKNRLDTFVDSFSSNTEFEVISSKENKSGTWEKTWTRIERVFTTEIP